MCEITDEIAGDEWSELEEKAKKGTHLAFTHLRTKSDPVFLADKKRAANGKRRDSDDSDSDRPKKKAGAKVNGVSRKGR